MGVSFEEYNYYWLLIQLFFNLLKIIVISEFIVVSQSVKFVSTYRHEHVIRLPDRSVATEGRDQEHDASCHNQDDRRRKDLALHEVTVFPDICEDQGSCYYQSNSWYLRGNTIFMLSTRSMKKKSFISTI